MKSEFTVSYVPKTDLEILRGIDPTSYIVLDSILEYDPEFKHVCGLILETLDETFAMDNTLIRGIDHPNESSGRFILQSTCRTSEHMPEANPEVLIVQLSEEFPGYAFYLHTDEGKSFVAKDGEADLWQTLN